MDVFADVLILGNIDLHHEIELAGGRIELGYDLPVIDFVGYGICLSRLALKLNEHACHGIPHCGSGISTDAELELLSARRTAQSGKLLQSLLHSS